MGDLIAIGYSDLKTAEAAREKLLDLQRGGLLTVLDAAVVEATPTTRSNFTSAPA